jgi:hypothetical protein
LNAEGTDDDQDVLYEKHTTLNIPIDCSHMSFAQVNTKSMSNSIVNEAQTEMLGSVFDRTAAGSPSMPIHIPNYQTAGSHNNKFVSSAFSAATIEETQNFFPQKKATQSGPKSNSRQ